MTDYYPLLARAVSGLDKSTGEARRALYERARTALVAQLRGTEPPLSESEITRERLALEEAVRRVEADAARQSRSPAVASPPPERPPRGGSGLDSGSLGGAGHGGSGHGSTGHGGAGHGSTGHGSSGLGRNGPGSSAPGNSGSAAPGGSGGSGPPGSLRGSGSGTTGGAGGSSGSSGPGSGNGSASVGLGTAGSGAVSDDFALSPAKASPEAGSSARSPIESRRHAEDARKLRLPSLSERPVPLGGPEDDIAGDPAGAPEPSRLPPKPPGGTIRIGLDSLRRGPDVRDLDQFAPGPPAPGPSVPRPPVARPPVPPGAPHGAPPGAPAGDGRIQMRSARGNLRRPPPETEGRPPPAGEPPPPDEPPRRRRRPPGPSPRRPVNDEPGPANPVRRGLIAALVTVLLIVGLGGTAYWKRDVIAGWFGAVRGANPFASRDPGETRPKASDRVGQDQVGRPSQPGQSTTPGTPAALVAQRVVLYEEDPGNPEGNRFVGSALWRTERVAPGPGRSPELAVRVDVEIPERRLAMTMSIRRNADDALPASHTVEIVFNIPSDFTFGGVADVPGLLMKEAEQARGAPLSGLGVKVTDGFFLIGLSKVEADLQRNLQLLKDRGWFDIPMVYNNGRRAILAVEKGTPGERAFSEGFTAWGN